MKPILLFALAAACAATPALAADTASSKSSRDPNRVVCRSEQVVGSRLAKAERCMTAAEWAEVKRLDREAIEKRQNRDQRSD